MTRKFRRSTSKATKTPRTPLMRSRSVPFEKLESRAMLASSGTGLFGDSGQNLGFWNSEAVELADLDGDGDLDAFVVNAPARGSRSSNGGANRVWLNDGTGVFRDSGQALGDAKSFDVAIGDLDADGDLDAVVANDGTNRLWLNDGKATFHPSDQVLGGEDAHSQAIALADLDGDGDLDAFVGNAGVHQGNVVDEVWLNDGVANFRKSVDFQPTTNSNSITLEDLDNDGDVDAILGFQGEPWLNQGDAVFVRRGSVAKELGADVFALGDLNNDGNLDAFLGSGGNRPPVQTRLGDGAGGYVPGWQASEEESHFPIEVLQVGDLDGDGDLDAFLIGGYSNEVHHVWLNDGVGGFSRHVQGESDWEVHDIALGDLDGDGDLDAFLVNGDYYSGAPNQVWLNSDVNADLVVTMTDQLYHVGPNQEVTYQIVVTNLGPDDLNEVTVSDMFPAEMEGVRWSCVAEGGAACESEGFGHIQRRVRLPAGGLVRYEATGTIVGTAKGRITNVVSAVASDGHDDLDSTNNVARDVNVISDTRLTPSSESHSATEDRLSLELVDVDPERANAASFVIHSLQSNAAILSSSVEENRISFIPSRPFSSGEMVQVTSRGELAGLPQVWRFRNGVGQGTGQLGHDGQHLGNAHTSAVAIGDLDNDGDLDVIFGNDGPNTVWLNDAEGQLLNTHQELGGDRTSSITLGDLDSDGDLDAFLTNTLYCAGDSCRRQYNQIWLNDGHGQFTATEQRVGSATGDVALGDLDGDGDLDAYLTNFPMDALTCTFCRPPGGADQVWLNDGNGVFVDSGQKLDYSYGRSVSLSDLDGDGDLDAFVANRNGNSVWFNDGQANFNDSGQRLGTLHSHAVDLGDLDGDGDPDAFVGNSNYEHGQHDIVWWNDGGGRFVDSGQRLGNAPTAGVTLGDVDADGDLDAFAAVGSNSPDILWINHHGQFEQQLLSHPKSRSYAVALGDMDGDGDLDAVTGEGASGRGAANKVLRNADLPVDLSITINDDSHFAFASESVTYTISVTNHGDHDVSVARVDAQFPSALQDVEWSCVASSGAICTLVGSDGINDSIEIPTAGVVTYSATGTWSDPTRKEIARAEVSLPGGLQDGNVSNNVALDVNVSSDIRVSPSPASHTASGTPEIAFEFDDVALAANITPNTVAVHASSVYRVESVRSEGDRVTLFSDDHFRAGEVVTVTAQAGENGEHTSPYVWQFRVAPTQGTGRFFDSGQRLASWGSGAKAEFADLDGDGDLDALMVGRKHDFGPLHSLVWINDGHGRFRVSGQQLGSVFNPIDVSLGDVDGDGDLDAFVAEKTISQGGRIKVWNNTGDGQFTDGGRKIVSGQTNSVTFGDLDGDGDLDAVMGIGSSWESLSNEVWINKGNGEFTDRRKTLGVSDTRNISLGDLDGDGDLDAVVANALAPNEVWLNDGKGDFRSTGQTIGTSQNSSVAIGDLDGDGDNDVVTDRVWLNDGSGHLVITKSVVANAHSESILLGDFDGDGDLDLIVRDESLGTTVRLWINDGDGQFRESRLHLNGDEATVAAIGDVDNDGDLDLLVGGQALVDSAIWANEDGFSGDVDGDHVVRFSDFLILSSNFGSTDADLDEGDLNGDRRVDFADFLILADSFGRGTG